MNLFMIHDDGKKSIHKLQDLVRIFVGTFSVISLYLIGRERVKKGKEV